MADTDVIVIGSGMAGVHASQTLLERGLRVLMIDVGKRPPINPDEAPAGNFEDIRKTDTDQHRWFLGDDLSGIPVDGLTGGLGGGQLSGNRRYVVEAADKLLPLETGDSQVVQSLAEGGLGAAWGATCALLSSTELTAMGLEPGVMEYCYDEVIKRIGISGPQTHAGIQPPIPADHHAQSALERYSKKKGWFEREHLTVTQSHTALLTQPLGNRKVTELQDMEYWADPGRSVYRPQFTLESLKQNQAFWYEPGLIAETFKEANGECIVTTKPIDDRTHQVTFSAKKMILAAGAVGSARLALRSRNMIGVPLPFIGKPHVFSACLQPSTLGMAGPKQRSSLCQLLILDEEQRSGLTAGCAQLYSYRSMLLFRLLSGVPLPTPDSLRLLNLWSPALVIADIRFPGLPGNGSLQLTKTEHGDRLKISCTVPESERAARHKSWKRIKIALWKIGLWPLNNMELPEASTSHFGGTLPMGPSSAPLTTDADCKLSGTENVYVADAAVFSCLPAKPHSLTIMANAHRVAEGVGTILQ